MRITARIVHYQKGVIAFLLAPFLWLQMYFFALENWLFTFIYDELFRKKGDSDYSQTTHLFAFICFSAFCLLAYYKKIENYISLILYGLWLINSFSVKFKTGLYVQKSAWIRLEHKADYWQWQLIAHQQCQESQRFTQQDIKGILIAVATYGDTSFRNQVLQIWHVFIQTKDEQQWLIYQEAQIEAALTKAVDLAAQFNTHVTIAESYGTGIFPALQIEPQDLIHSVWHKKRIGQEWHIYKNFSTLSFIYWLNVLLEKIKDFIFIAILSGVMSRYGLLLLILFGHDLGLALPEVIYIDMRWGLLSFFAPDFNWGEVFLFTMTFVMVCVTIYQENRHHEIIMNQRRMCHFISGKKIATLYFTQKPAIIVLKGFDKTSLIFVNEQNKILEINGLADNEYDELCAIWLTL